MVATPGWKKIEPEISLEGFLASEEIDFFPSALSWMPDDWAAEASESAAYEAHDY